MLCQADIDAFKTILDPENGVAISSVLTDDEARKSHSIDWLQQYTTGFASVVLKPSSVEELSKVLRHCYDRKLAVVPQGGNTGLVGGATPIFDEVVISTGRMNTIHGFDPINGVLTCDAGVVLEDAENYLREQHQHSHTMPLDLGAKGSCHIGGNIATNAG